MERKALEAASAPVGPGDAGEREAAAAAGTGEPVRVVALRAVIQKLIARMNAVESLYRRAQLSRDNTAGLKLVLENQRLMLNALAMLLDESIIRDGHSAEIEIRSVVPASHAGESH